LKTLVGAWIGDDKINNQVEIDNIISIAKKGYGDMIAIGNEVLLREDLEVEELIDYIQQVKQAVPNIPVGYVDAYYMYVNYPKIVDACDVISVNCYPFWEHCPLDISVEFMKKMYELAVKHSKGKQVIISETGWATKSNHAQTKANIANEENQKIFNSVIDKWTEKNQITCFFFEAFDEPWKGSTEV
jgi:exo-beta-1,3-glucanase (GH17 family)